jgi:hypothetical protein
MVRLPFIAVIAASALIASARASGIPLLGMRTPDGDGSAPYDERDTNRTQQ